MRNDGIHIRIADVLYGVMKRRVLIILLTLAGLGVGIVLSGVSYLRGEMSKEYIVTCSFSVNTQTHSGLYTSGYDFPSYNDINMAEKLVDSVAYVVKSDRMMDSVIDSLDLLGIAAKDITDNLKISQYNETQILEMELYWRNSQEGISILNAINAKAPQMLNEVLGIGTVSVINSPTSKYLLGGSINVILWGYTTLFGFILGIGITLLELVMKPTLLNVQDMEQMFGLDVLCEISEDESYFDRPETSLIEDDSFSDIAESFASAAHIINTKLRKHNAPKIIYVTSSLRGEGKTNVVANLAVRLSDLEKKVLLVDFDMKNPQLCHHFLKKVDYDHSLNALYAEDINAAEAITSLSGYLDILPTVLDHNTIPLDRNLFHMIESIAVHYDYVLIDTAPVGLTADPMSLNQLASSAIFVTRYDLASMQEITDALERIEKSGVSILGSIVNGVHVSRKTIYNPVKEKEKVRQEKNRDQRKSAPLTNLSNENGTIGSDETIKPLVAGFADEQTHQQKEGSEMIQSDEEFIQATLVSDAKEEDKNHSK